MALPVTLLSGFLGAGKTTLLEHILKGQHGYKIAVIVNDMSSVNIDAELVRNHSITKTQEKLIQMQNGCICCTLRGDLLEELAALAKMNKYDYVVIESTGISEPMQVAETFTTEFSQALLHASEHHEGDNAIVNEPVIKEIIQAGGLEKLAYLDTCVTMIDALNFLSNLETADFLSDRYGAEDIAEDERTITHLMVDQLEFADVIIINKIDTLIADNKITIEKIIKKLNPVAKILVTNYSKVDLKEVIGTNLFDFDKAQTSAGWLRSLFEMTVKNGYGTNGKMKITPKPETLEYNIGNFVYESRRPFVPERLYKLIYGKFILMQSKALPPGSEDDKNTDDEGWESGEEENEVEDEKYPEISNEQVVKNKKNSIFSSILRSKGFFWLATRPIQRGEWSQAGLMLTMSGGGPWFCVLDEESWPEHVLESIKEDFVEPFGDRRQQIVFIGENINQTAISSQLDKCLLNDVEMKHYNRIMNKQKWDIFKKEQKLQDQFEDGFEDWPLDGDEDDENDSEDEDSLSD